LYRSKRASGELGGDVSRLFAGAGVIILRQKSIFVGGAAADGGSVELSDLLISQNGISNFRFHRSALNFLPNDSILIIEASDGKEETE
jgi:hypothetical protein